MAGEQLKTFMMGLGFQLDTAGMAKLEAFVKNTEAYAKQSAANIDKLVKTLEGYTKGLSKTTSEADKHKQSQDKQTQAAKEFCKQLEECLKGLTKTVQELGKHQEAQDKDTKSTDGATDSLKRHGEAHHRMREVWKLSKEAAIGFTGAISALAITGEEMVRRVSKQFEQLFYLSQRTGVAGHSIEQLRFQFKSIGLDAAQADQAVSALAAQFADFPSMRSTVENMIKRPFKDAGDAVNGFIEVYAELLRTGDDPGIAAYRDRLRFAGIDPEAIAQGARNIRDFSKAAEDHHKILHDLGIEGEESAKQLEARSVAFRKEWIKTQETLGKVVDIFAGALMPGMTRFLRAVLGAGGIGDVNESFDELGKQFDAWVLSIVGPNGENVKEWFVKIRESLIQLKDTFIWLEEHIGFTPTLLLAAFAPSIVKGLVSGLTSSIITGFTGLGTSAGGAFAAGFIVGLPALVLGALGLGESVISEKMGVPNPSARRSEELDVSRGHARSGRGVREGSPIARFFDWIGGGTTEDATPRVGHAAGGIVGINAHAGEAVLPVSLTNMLLRAANQPQPFNAARGQDSVTEVLDRLANDFNQWWSGSASFNPIVQLASDFYDKLSALLHQLLEDFGFEQKAVSTPGGSGAGTGAGAGAGGAGSGAGGGDGAEGGGGGGAVRPGGRFGGMGPGGGGGGKTPDLAKGNYRNQAIDYFTSQGWTREQAAGIAANLETESSWNAGARGDGGKAYGVGQWHPDRQANFKKVYGKDIREATMGEQLAFVNWELNNTEKAAGDRLRKTTSSREAGGVVSRYYERPRDVHGNVAQRGALAEGIHTGYSPSGTQMPGEGGVPDSEGGRVKELQGRLAAIRRLPLAARLKAQLEYASEQTGVTTEVFSGGQAESGSNRTGSHRHDRGEAGDVQLRDPKTGQLLDMRNSADQARMAQFVSASVAAGASGVGGAEGYMGAHGLHIGGGTAGTWGASGSFGTAPKWLQDAYREGIRRRGEVQREARQRPTPVSAPETPTVTPVGTRGLGTDKPAWRNERGAADDPTGGDYGGGGKPSWFSTTSGFGPMLKDFLSTKGPSGLVPMLGEHLREKLGGDSFNRNLGTDKPAWRNERGANSGDYGGGSDERQVVHKSETTINVVGAADPHGTARAVRDLNDRNSPLQKRGRQTNFA